MECPNHEESEEFRMSKPQKSAYIKTSMKKKQKLIDLVLNHKMTIYRASKIVRMNVPTAKLIFRNFQKYGVILQRNSRSYVQKIDNNSQLKNIQAKTQKLQKLERQSPNTEQYKNKSAQSLQPTKTDIKIENEFFQYIQFPIMDINYGCFYPFCM